MAVFPDLHGIIQVFVQYRHVYVQYNYMYICKIFDMINSCQSSRKI